MCLRTMPMLGHVRPIGRLAAVFSCISRCSLSVRRILEGSGLQPLRATPTDRKDCTARLEMPRVPSHHVQRMPVRTRRDQPIDRRNDLPRLLCACGQLTPEPGRLGVDRKDTIAELALEPVEPRRDARLFRPATRRPMPLAISPTVSTLRYRSPSGSSATAALTRGCPRAGAARPIRTCRARPSQVDAPARATIGAPGRALRMIRPWSESP